MDGKIYTTNQFRGSVTVPPSTEIDEAWRRISVGWSKFLGMEIQYVDVKSLGIPGIRVYDGELKTLNRPTDLKKYHKLPEESGGGYLAMLEVFHLLHCLVSRLCILRNSHPLFILRRREDSEALIGFNTQMVVQRTLCRSLCL